MARQRSTRPRAVAFSAMLGAVVAIIVVSVVAARAVIPSELERAVGDVADCSTKTADYEQPARLGWPHLVKATRVYCDDGAVSPEVIVARFASATDARRDLLAHPDPWPVCVGNTEVYLNLLDDAFGEFCRGRGGHVIDVVSGLPELPADGTMAGEDAALDKQLARDAGLQGAALRRYWAR